MLCTLPNRTKRRDNMKYRLLDSIALCTLLAPLLANADATESSLKGSVSNDAGEKCSYTQEIKLGNTYFHGDLKGNNAIMTFDNPECMKDNGLGLDINKMMINNIISRWYSLSDAKFMTRTQEMKSTSTLQQRGLCIQSKTYPSQAIAIDYSIKNESIVSVIHGATIDGCK